MNISNLVVVLSALLMFSGCGNAQTESKNVSASGSNIKETSEVRLAKPITVIDSSRYKILMQKMFNGDSSGKWNFNGHYPLPGAILPFHRVIAYYGNLYSTRMGILGELPKPQMFAKLKSEMEVWKKADPETPVMPALHYIVTTAQGSPGPSGKYRLRMPNKEIDKVLAMAEEIGAVVFLDIQVGLSNLREEIPVIEKYLLHPKVHLGIDPEFSMKGGERPGSVIGHFTAVDINYATQYLADIVTKNNLPPKMLVVHRFTQNMVKDYRQIVLRPQVQVVVDMDGWGAPARKINTYKQFAYREPIQFTGFKLFYKNDLKEPPHRMLTAKELLSLKPAPMYIQYQ